MACKYDRISKLLIICMTFTTESMCMKQKRGSKQKKKKKTKLTKGKRNHQNYA